MNRIYSSIASVSLITEELLLMTIVAAVGVSTASIIGIGITMIKLEKSKEQKNLI